MAVAASGHSRSASSASSELAPLEPFGALGVSETPVHLGQSTQRTVQVDDNLSEDVLMALAELAPRAADVGWFKLDENVIKALPVPECRVISSTHYGQSFWGPTAKIMVEVYVLEAFGNTMSTGEFESLRTIYSVSPGYCPRPLAHGRYAKQEPETYFLLMEFCEFGKVPADPKALGKSLADMHKASQSPTGKFGFHTATCYSRIVQDVDHWDDSWCALFTRHLARFAEHASRVLKWPELDVLATCILEKVVPRLLLPLQENGRTIKASLCHGDCWDGNTAMDMKTGRAMVFDACTFYSHNEYDIGNWRAPRRRLSNQAYVKAYKQNYRMSEPVEDWDDRNRLYSLPYNIGSACYVPGSDQRPAIYKDMEFLCKKFCPDFLEHKMQELRERQKAPGVTPSELVKAAHNKGDANDRDEGEDEEEEEEEEEQELD